MPRWSVDIIRKRAEHASIVGYMSATTCRCYRFGYRGRSVNTCARLIQGCSEQAPVSQRVVEMNEPTRTVRSALLVAALVVAPAVASADVFNVSGMATNETASAIGTCASGAICMFSGTLTVDVTGGLVHNVSITFPGLATFDSLEGQGSISGGFSIDAINSSLNALALDFTTTPTPGSLVGFTGGTIFGNAVSTAVNTPAIYGSLTGSITVPAVPEPSTWAMML